MRRQGSGHGGVLGDVGESSGREGNASQSTGDPVRGLFLRTERQNAQGNRPQVKIIGEKVERVAHFKYLGTSTEEEGGMETEISKRVGAACRNWKRCSGVLCDKRLAVKLKGKVSRSTEQLSDQLWSGNIGHHQTTGSNV